MLPRDPFILISSLNMKLRDSSDSLRDIIADMDPDADFSEVLSKLEQLGYCFNEETRRIENK